MLNKLLLLIREYDMAAPGDTVYCAVSGGADSMALLWGMYLLKEKLNIRLRAVHFNHHLRQKESDRDEQFVRGFCDRFSIPLTVGQARVVAGEKGLEAAAREARYAFFETLPGKTATAHTADDNAETVLMRMVRGTGLKGLGGICPVRGNLIRPMLSVTRREVLAFLEQYHIRYVEDSSNASDVFLRNRLRHHVLPLLRRENPRIAENLSAMALRLREDEQALADMAPPEDTLRVSELRHQPKARRSRTIAAFLESCGVREPEAQHIALAEKLIFSEKPSAKADFPGGVTLTRRYDLLTAAGKAGALPKIPLKCPGVTPVPEAGLQVSCREARGGELAPDAYTVYPDGALFLRSRLPGDEIRLSGGSKSVKKLFIDEKIPADQRPWIPLVCDEKGILCVYGFGVNLARQNPGTDGVEIRFERV